MVVNKVLGDTVYVYAMLTNIGNIDVLCNTRLKIKHIDTGIEFEYWDLNNILVGGYFEQEFIDILIDGTWPQGLYNVFIDVYDEHTQEIIGQGSLPDAINLVTLRAVSVENIRVE